MRGVNFTKKYQRLIQLFLTLAQVASKPRSIIRMSSGAATAAMVSAVAEFFREYWIGSSPQRPSKVIDPVASHPVETRIVTPLLEAPLQEWNRVPQWFDCALGPASKDLETIPVN